MTLKEAIKHYLNRTPVTYSEFETGDPEVKVVYMRQDASSPPELYDILIPKIREQGLEESYKIEINNIAPTIEMNSRGIRFDIQSALARQKSNIARAKQLEQSIDPTGILNLNSPIQLRQFLHDRHSLPLILVNGKLSTDKKTLQLLYQRTKNPLINDILEYKELIAEAKFLKSFQQYMDKATNCIYPYINSLGTETGRSSSSMPNLQNIKRDDFSRRLFMAREGRKLLCFDQCQIEPLILAELVDPGPFKNLFLAENADCYLSIASLMSRHLGVEIDRSTAKVLLLAVMYGMGPYSVADHLGIHKLDGQKILDSFFHLFPEIRVLESRLYQAAKKVGYAKTILGRRRYIENLNSSDFKLASRARRQVLNSVIQGTAAELFKRQVRHVRNALPMDCYLLLVVHDEILLECPKDKTNEYFEIAKRKLEEAPTWFPLPLKVKGGVGSTWADAKT